MNRSIIYLGIGILLVAFAFIAFPIAVTGQEQFDLEQEVGLYLIAPSLAVILVGSISSDPRQSTVGGAFGNPEAAPRRPGGAAGASPAAPALRYRPGEPVRCRYCESFIPEEYAQCRRCARPRECRNCYRPLGIVLDRPTCPTCARAEPFCNCPRLAQRAAVTVARGRRV